MVATPVLLSEQYWLTRGEASSPNAWFTQVKSGLQADESCFLLCVRASGGEGAWLPYPDAAFDAVVASLVLCSVADQRTVLAEVRRVLRPGGHFLFLEHVAAASPRVRAWQRRLSPVQRFFADGCELDRDTASAIRAGGFARTHIEEVELSGAPILSRKLIVGVAVA